MMESVPRPNPSKVGREDPVPEYSPAELVQKWEEFFDAFDYAGRILSIADAYPETRTLEVPFDELNRFDTDFAIYFLHRPANAIAAGEGIAVARVTDVYAALPSITGKFEMEYEGELKGAEAVARELIRASVATVADGYLAHLETRRIIEWFDLGGSLQFSDTMSAAEVLSHARQVQGLVELGCAAGVPANASEPMLAAGVDFLLEGLYATKKISRSDERGYHGAEPPVRNPTREVTLDEEPKGPGGGRKKYYN